jgi:hypothetical protein
LLSNFPSQRTLQLLCEPASLLPCQKPADFNAHAACLKPDEIGGRYWHVYLRAIRVQPELPDPVYLDQLDQEAIAMQFDAFAIRGMAGIYDEGPRYCRHFHDGEAKDVPGTTQSEEHRDHQRHGTQRYIYQQQLTRSDRTITS